MDDVDPRVLAGTLVGERYKIVELLKRSAFALSFRATDQQDGRAVYLRLFFCPEDALEEVERALATQFVRSAQVMMELSRVSPAIVHTQLGRRPHPLPSGRKVPWVVHEWIEGSTLAEFQGGSDGPTEATSLRDALDRYAAIIDLLVRAHDRGIVHRRLDPTRVWVVDHEVAAEASLKLDGFSGRANPGEGPRVPASVPREPPSPHYAAPEQQQEGDHDREGAWSDVYSVAMLLLDNLLAQTTAWEEWDRRRRIGSDEPTAPGVLPTPRRLGLTVSDAEERVFECALQPDPDLRFRSMREFRDALIQAADGKPLTWTKQAFAARSKTVGTFENATPAPKPDHQAAPPVTLQISEPSRDTDEFLITPRAGNVHPSDLAIVTPRASAMRSSASAKEDSPTPGAPASRRAPSSKPISNAKLFGAAGLAVALVTTVGVFVMRRDFAPTTNDPTRAAVAARPATANPPEPTAQPVRPPVRCPPEMVAIDITQAPPTSSIGGRYCLQRHEVTVSQYQACTMANACSPPLVDSSWPHGSEPERAANSELCNWRYGDKATHPVNCVDWKQATDYCAFRGWRLPSSSEWELAARGPEGHQYPWGNEPPDETRANACGLECRAWRADRNLDDTEVMYEAKDRFPGTAPVGSFPRGATAAGIEDLAGNVFEWVADVDPAEPELRSIRGGGFDQVWPEALLSEVAVRQPGTEHAHSLGFRCAMTLDAG